ncbi:carbamoyltransferase C-terminal domain-containing protein [Ferrovibrio xuzhouensis]|uniref:Carbamoyltransferase C-terminal domain-containing protein n=1 Tax=Ferrovibrio xuzhouensis TaxID=1576914 RepID=A0ABV7VES9_9PROT
MLILGIHPGHRDACAVLFDGYRMVAGVAQERLTRRPGDGGRIPFEAIAECLAVAGAGPEDLGAVTLSRGYFPSRYFRHFPLPRRVESRVRAMVGLERHASMEREAIRYGRSDSAEMFYVTAFLRDLGCRSDLPLRFCNHHTAQALAALFHTGWDEALVYTAGEGGDNASYGQRLLKYGRIATLGGDDTALAAPAHTDSLARLGSFAAEAVGLRAHGDAALFAALAAQAEPMLAAGLAAHFHVADDGRIDSDFAGYAGMRRWLLRWAAGHPAPLVAAAVQKVTRDVMAASIAQVLQRHELRHLAVAGGLFADAALNRHLAETLPLAGLAVYPAAGGRGVAEGSVLQYLLERDGVAQWLTQRRPLDHFCYGRDYDGDIDPVLAGAGARLVSSEPARAAAALINAGKLVALYAGGMEYGPQALGARSILAAPRRAAAERLRHRLGRPADLPFAPVVRAADAAMVFDLPPLARDAARFRAIACAVREPWRERLAPVLYADGSARPQVLDDARPSLCHDILSDYAALSGMPVLIQAGFTLPDEPLVNTPAECLRALRDGRVDYVATASAVWEIPA